MKHKGILMYLMSAVVSVIDDLGLRNIVRETQFGTATFIVAFERLLK